VADVLFTLPGKVGDNLCRVPIAYQYSKQRRCPVDICLDNNSAGLIPLLSNEPWTDRVFCADGVSDYGMGGQPIDFGRDDELRAAYREVYHLGYRHYPSGNLTACTINDTPIDDKFLLTDSCLSFARRPVRNLLLQCESSRRGEDEFAVNTLADILEAGAVSSDGIVISTFQTRSEDPLYDRLRKYGPRFEHCDGFLDIARLAQDSVMFTTFSAASCLAYIAKFPLVVVSSGATGLQHYDCQRSYYGLDRYIRHDTAAAARALKELKNGT
jgi:hypothetical protein